MSENKPVSVRRLIGIGVATRLLIDSTVQIFFPFLTVFATGLGLSNTQMGQLISLRSFSGMFAPIIGSWADDHGYRRVIQIALGVSALSALVIGINLGFIPTVIAMAFMGLGLSTFTPNLSAYLSARLPYAKRARGLGTLEYAWALSSIIGLPLAGLLIVATNWRMPFFIIAGLLFIAMIGYGWLPEVVPEKKDAAPTSFKQFFDFGSANRSAWGTIFTGYFIMFGAMHTLFSYGIWFATEYGFEEGALAWLAFMIGCADICGSGTASFVDDYLGKRNSVMLGAVLAVIAFLILPFFNVGMVMALIGLFIARSLFEFTVVSNLILSSEQVPEQRGKMLALVAAASTLGIFTAGLTSPPVYEAVGIQGLAWPSAFFLIIAGLCMWRFVVDKE